MSSRLVTLVTDDWKNPGDNAGKVLCCFGVVKRVGGRVRGKRTLKVFSTRLRPGKFLGNGLGRKANMEGRGEQTE